MHLLSRRGLLAPALVLLPLSLSPTPGEAEPLGGSKRVVHVEKPEFSLGAPVKTGSGDYISYMAQFPVHWLGFSRDGKSLIVTRDEAMRACSPEIFDREEMYREDDGGVIEVWDLETRSRIPFPAPSVIARTETLALSPDGNNLAAVHEDGKLRTWDLKTGRKIQELNLNPKHAAHNYHYESPLVYTAEGQLFCTADYNVRPISYAPDVNTIKNLKLNLNGRQSVVFSPDGQKACVQRYNGKAKMSGADLFDIHSGKRLSSWPHRRGVVFSPDGACLLVVNYDNQENGLYQLVDTQRGTLLRTLTRASGKQQAAFSAGGEYLATTNSRRIEVWKPATGELVRSFPYDPDGLNSSSFHEGVTALGFSPDNRFLAVGYDNGTVTMWGLPG